MRLSFYLWQMLKIQKFILTERRWNITCAWAMKLVKVQLFCLLIFDVLYLFSLNWIENNEVTNHRNHTLELETMWTTKSFTRNWILNEFKFYLFATWKLYGTVFYRLNTIQFNLFFLINQTNIDKNHYEQHLIDR